MNNEDSKKLKKSDKPYRGIPTQRATTSNTHIVRSWQRYRSYRTGSRALRLCLRKFWVEMIGILSLPIALHPDVAVTVDNNAGTVTIITAKHSSECGVRPTRGCQLHVRVIITIG